MCIRDSYVSDHIVLAADFFIGIGLGLPQITVGERTENTPRVRRQKHLSRRLIDVDIPVVDPVVGELAATVTLGLGDLIFVVGEDQIPVSDTHLDVYKRQALSRALSMTL